MSKVKLKLTIEVMFLIAFFALFAAFSAFATGNHECQGGHNCNNEGGPINVEAEAQSEATATADAAATSTVYSEGGEGGLGGEGGAANATNEGITVDTSEETRIENNSSNIVLVPNNNTENCLRVIGISFGNNGSAGALGWPYRSAKCDYEQAADDAFAAGEREIGWFWKCQNRNLYKKFKDKGETAEQAAQDCYHHMVGKVTLAKTVTSLTEQLRVSEEERRIARELHKESVERINAACNESKNRMMETCRTGK
jgi:hypothetical protein